MSSVISVTSLYFTSSVPFMSSTFSVFSVSSMPRRMAPTFHNVHTAALLLSHAAGTALAPSNTAVMLVFQPLQENRPRPP